jgi:hypothetical protein
MDEFYDIYGVWHIPWWQQPLFKIIALAIGCFVLLVLVLYLIKRFTSRKKQLKPWELAGRDLAVLGDPDNINQHKAKIFYSRLTAIVKQYLCFRYGFDIMGKTDHEILMLLDSQIVFPKDLLPILSEVLGHASQIKFANTVGIEEQMQSDLALCNRLVIETIPSQS